MNNTKSALLISIFRIHVKGKKHYAVPSIKALINLLSTRHATEVKRRWTFQCLHDIEDLGFIARRTRYDKDTEGAIRQLPGMIAITLKGARHLYNLGVEGAERLTKEILGWIRGGDQRFPEHKKELLKLTPEEIEFNKFKIGELLATIA